MRNTRAIFRKSIEVVEESCHQCRRFKFAMPSPGIAVIASPTFKLVLAIETGQYPETQTIVEDPRSIS